MSLWEYDGYNQKLDDSGICRTLRIGRDSSDFIAYLTNTLTKGETMTTPNLVVRRLSPIECELLMGWDANWTAIGVNEDGTEFNMADSHRYKMCGNGVVSNVAEWFGTRYLTALAEAESAN